jgi:hypothetical protein
MMDHPKITAQNKCLLLSANRTPPLTSDQNSKDFKST